VETRRSTLILAACLWISACGSKSRPPNPEERTPAEQSSTKPAASSPAEDSRPVIVTFGDSLTAGVVPANYPDALQRLLDQNGYHYRIDNQGVSGDTTTDGLARIDNVIAARPALVLLEFGGNDGLRGIPVDATQKNLDEMIVKLKTAQIPVILLGITLPPNYGPDYVKPFTAMFPALAKKHKLTLMPFLLVHVYRDGNLMRPDGIHPNGEGNEIVAKDVFDLIQPALKRTP
jgi:acyl-CoA thioesterase-1